MAKLMLEYNLKHGILGYTALQKSPRPPDPAIKMFLRVRGLLLWRRILPYSTLIFVAGPKFAQIRYFVTLKCY